MSHKNMWDEKFVRLKTEFIEIILTIKQMLTNPLMMILHCLWLVITFQEEKFINNAKKIADEDRKTNQMPNEFIQGTALAVCEKFFFFFFRRLKLLI